MAVGPAEARWGGAVEAAAEAAAGLGAGRCWLVARLLLAGGGAPIGVLREALRAPRARGTRGVVSGWSGRLRFAGGAMAMAAAAGGGGGGGGGGARVESRLVASGVFVGAFEVGLLGFFGYLVTNVGCGCG